MKEKTEPSTIEEIGARIRSEREKLGLSREKFAEIISLSPFYIGQIERGERNMSIDTLLRISNSLNISTDYILKGYTLYMENILTLDAMENNYKAEIDDEIKDLLSIISGSSKEKVQLIKDITKLVLPYLNK